MAILSAIASTSAGCGGGAVNTGQLGCTLGFGYAVHAIRLKKGTIIPASTDFTLDYWDILVQDGTATPLMNAFSSEPTFAEDTVETSPTGIEALTLQGFPKYAMTYKEGEYYYKELAKLTGFGNSDFVLGDVNGNWLFATDASGDFKGFSAGQVNALMTTPATATETRKKTVTFQLINRLEIDTRYEIIVASVGFPISDVTGINGVIMTFEDANGAVPPANLAVTLKVKVVLAADKITGFEGLAADGSDFLYTVDTASEVPAVVDDGDGFYTLTVTALATAGELTLQAYDGSVNKNVANVSNVLIRNLSILTATVIV